MKKLDESKVNNSTETQENKEQNHCRGCKGIRTLSQETLGKIQARRQRQNHISKAN